MQLSSDSTVKDLKIGLYSILKQSPCDQLIYSYEGGEILEDEVTLQQAQVPKNNSDNVSTISLFLCLSLSLCVCLSISA